MSGSLARVRGRERSAAWPVLEGHARDSSPTSLLIEVRVERCGMERLGGRAISEADEAAVGVLVAREVSGGSGDAAPPLVAVVFIIAK